ncbi:Lanosterol synthase [Oopsacas minuta]|uniref:Terpene cyclase/mutase family member n=1 Tax=Oopsacas minuta TaxID=111878 RepID=A0AAV7KK90_9METZ|nr:Lanosterol synthase [Oopsacas minuta]
MKTAWRYPAQTDLTKWRLSCDRGRQIWNYCPNPAEPQTFFERYALGLTDKQPKSVDTSVAEGLRLGSEFYCKLQSSDGHWAGDYGGPLFLLPGLLIVCYVCSIPLSCEEREEMVRYLRNSQHSDGGWGLHTSDKSTMFGTVLNYISMRILGVPATDPDSIRARELFLSWGGALSIPSWGKFWLCVLNVYSWEGTNCILPELWIMPTSLPVHPSRMWCHCRQVYLPMGYCYARRLSHLQSDPLVQSLRCELYLQPYDTIFWPSHRTNICSRDIYTPHHPALIFLLRILNRYEATHTHWVRELAVTEILRQIKADDEFSDFISIGPISKVIQTLVTWHSEGAESNRFHKHVTRLRDYLWMGTDGLKMQGTNGSQLWDTALAVQSLVASINAGGLSDDVRHTLKNAHAWLRETQIQDNPPDYGKFYRQANKGAFPFSTHDCGWIVSDCTAEGLKALLILETEPMLRNSISDMTPSQQLFDGVDILLQMQNSDGGYASYEQKRGGVFLEALNPSEVFGDIMIDYSYTECTSAVIQALSLFSQSYPDHRAGAITRALGKMENFVREKQRPDGSWVGSWGVCFTYGTWFGLEALAAMGHFSSDSAVRKGCEFLLERQRPDGGWGEDFESCTKGRYIQHDRSQVVNTSWALMALMAVEWPDRIVLEKGVKFLLSQQLIDGDWSEEEIKGVFNKSCAIVYSSYKNIFPIWALSKWQLLVNK